MPCEVEIEGVRDQCAKDQEQAGDRAADQRMHDQFRASCLRLGPAIGQDESDLRGVGIEPGREHAPP